MAKAVWRINFTSGKAWMTPSVYYFLTFHITVMWGRRKIAKYALHITGTRERYILDKSYWLVSSFNGNVVPLNGVRAELKREGKNKGMKYKPDGGKETAMDR